MIAGKRLFENHFDRAEIIAARLHNFAADAIGRITAANIANEYDSIIQELVPVHETFGIEIGEVKSALSVQKGSTLTVNGFIKNFKLYMSENEGVVAKAVGGFNSAAFLAFYPRGVNEYSKASKIKLPALFKQVAAAAELHQVLLGSTISAELKAFDINYQKVRHAQQLQKGTVGDNRVSRTANRQNLELALLRTIYNIAGMYPGETDKCLSFFDFSLLLPAGHKEKPELLI
jgi:hypothetical protein